MFIIKKWKNRKLGKVNKIKKLEINEKNSDTVY